MSILKKLTVVFENCESLSFTYPDVCAFFTGDITKSYSSCSNVIDVNQSTTGFTLVISKDAKVEQDDFGLFLGEMDNPVERFSCCDVTQINVTFEDDKQDFMFVEWAGESEQKHAGQRFVKTPEGNYLFYSESERYKNTMDVETADAFCDMSRCDMED